LEFFSFWRIGASDWIENKTYPPALGYRIIYCTVHGAGISFVYLESGGGEGVILWV
jgi:hypothetical protein